MSKQDFRILIVDDEESLRRAYCDALDTSSAAPSDLVNLESELFGPQPSAIQVAPRSFDLTSCYRGEDAVEQVRTSVATGNPFSVAFIDMRMPPGIDGAETAERIRQLDPVINIVVVTGYSDVDVSELARRILPADKLFFLAKPLQVTEIRHQAAALSARWKAETSMVRTLRQQNAQLQTAIEGARISKDEAIAANHAKSRFISNMSHELRTPLNAIIGFSSMLSDEVYGSMGDNRYIDYAREIGTAGVQLLKSINDVIDSAKLDIDGLRLDIEELDLSACLAAVMADMSNLMADRQIQLQLDAGEELPSVNGDARRTKQILHSIVHNAVKYSPQQALLLISVKPQGTFVRVSVVDRGCGISKETLDMTIRPFVDETNVLTKSHGGLGLGLWLSRRIMELQNGVITIVTSPDQGTSVHLDFPAF